MPPKDDTTTKIFKVGEIWNTSMPHHSKCVVLRVSPEKDRVLEFMSMSDKKTYKCIYGGWCSTFISRDEFLNAIYRRRHPDA